MAVPKKIPFPSSLAPAGMSVSLTSNTQVHVSTFTGTSQTVENVGATWMFNLSYVDLIDFQFKALMSAITRLRGMANRLMCYNFSRPEITGEQDVSNQIQNYNFLLSGSGWSESLGPGGKIYYADNKVRLVKGSVGVCKVSQSLTLDNNKKYSASISLLSGTYEEAVINIIDTSGGGNPLQTLSITAQGRHDLIFTGYSSVTLEVSTNNGVSGDFIFITDVVCARCAESNGVDQTGTVIDIDGLDINLDSAINSLDFINIGGEYKRVIEAVHTDGSGGAKIIIEPPMFKPLPDNSAVILNRPYAKFIMQNDAVTENISEPVMLNTSISLSEDLTLV